MDGLTKDVIQVIVWAIASVGGMIAAFKAIDEMRKKNEQARCDLRWAQAKQAKELIDELRADRLAFSTFQMMDWSGRSYKVEEKSLTIWFSDIGPALRTENLAFSDKEQFIRDCFDSLHDRFGRFEIYVQNRLVLLPDLSAYCRYYIGCMRPFKKGIESYLKEYGFDGAEAFLKRHKEWSDPVAGNGDDRIPSRELECEAPTRPAG